MMTKQELKEKIRDLEYYRSGYKKLGGGEDVEVRNVRIRKKDDLVLADVIFHEPCEGEHFRHDNVEYSLSELEKQ
jgi:hypothetical protein